MKRDNPWIDPRVFDLSVADVSAYLTSRGWTRSDYPGRPLFVFEAPFRDDNGDEIITVLPSAGGAPDFRSSAVTVVELIAFLDRQHPVAVLDEMLAAHAANGTAPQETKATV